MKPKSHLSNAGKELGQFVSSLWGDAVGRIVNPIQEWKATEKVRLPSRSVSSTLTCGRYKELYGDYSCRDGKDYPVYGLPSYMSEERKTEHGIFDFTKKGVVVVVPALTDTALKYSLWATPTLILKNNNLTEIRGPVIYDILKINKGNEIFIGYYWYQESFNLHYEGTIMDNEGLENSINGFMAAIDKKHKEIGIMVNYKTPLRVRELYAQLCKKILLDVKNYSDMLMAKPRSIDGFVHNNINLAIKQDKE